MTHHHAPTPKKGNAMSRTKKFADDVLGVSDPSLGDERERDVILRAYTLALQYGVTVLFLAALVMMAAGQSFWSIAVVILTGSTTWVAMWYARSEGVNLMEAIRLGGPRRKRLTTVLTIGYLVAWMGLYAYLLLAGEPLIPSPREPLSTVGSDGISTVIGGVVGAAAALAATYFIAMWLKNRSYEDAGDD